MPLSPWLALMGLSLGLAETRGEGEATLAPDRVMLGASSTPSTSFSVTWRTKPGSSGDVLEVSDRSGSPVRSFPAKTQVLDSASFKVGAIHESVAEGFQPGERVRYRVVSNGLASPWHGHRFAVEEPEPFEFIMTGDAQTYIKRVCTPIFERAFAQSSDARFMIQAGDLIDNNSSPKEWSEWHYAMNALESKLLVLATPGNHEYGIYGRNRNRTLTPMWKPMFSMPENGPSNLRELAWSMDYQGLRLISLDSMNPLEPQVKWMESLPANPNVKWTAVVMHYPVLPSMKGQEAPGRTKLLQAAFERLGVDFVITGHLHSYARSGLVKGSNVNSQDGGVVYVISVAGGKFYRQDKFSWMKRAFSKTNTYQVVRVSEKELSYKAYDGSGTVRDAFTLINQPNGSTSLREDLAPSG